MNPTERRLKNELKRKRIEIMEELTAIHKTHCEPCPLKDYDSLTACQNCQVFKDIRKLGNELIILANKKPREEGNFTEFKKKNSNSRPRNPLKNFTKKQYFKMKDMEMSDKRIAKEMGVSHSTFCEWKRKHKLVGEPISPRITVEEYLKLRDQGYQNKQIAEKKNMPVITLYHWRKKNNLV